MTNIFEDELSNQNWQNDLGIENYQNIHDLANNLDGNNILDHESHQNWQQNNQSLDWQDCQQYNTQDQNFDQSLPENWDNNFPSALDETWNNWHDQSASTMTELSNDHNQFVATNETWNNWHDQSTSTMTELSNDHNLYTASLRSGSSWHQEGAEMGSNGLSSLGIMRSGNSFQIKDELTKYSSQINNFGISHNEHTGTQDLKDTIERVSKDPHFSSMTPDENWKPSDLITHGYENDLHSTTAENVMLGRFESLWKIDKNLAGFLVHDLPEPFQTNFITFLGASHGSNGGSYHLSNYGWEMK